MEVFVIVAFDLSLARTGWAQEIGFGVVVAGGTGLPRLIEIRRRVLELAHGAELVLVEGYSYGSKGSAVVNIGELGGVVRVALYEARHPVVEIPPSCLKRYATGKGNAPKDEVLAAAIRRLNYQGHDHNEADALWMVQMALARSGRPEAVAVPVAHREGLAKVRWPLSSPTT
jgi:crossover junction endodeoxyribonuclease RuvC